MSRAELVLGADGPSDAIMMYTPADAERAPSGHT